MSTTPTPLADIRRETIDGRPATVANLSPTVIKVMFDDGEVAICEQVQAAHAAQAASTSSQNPHHSGHASDGGR